MELINNIDDTLTFENKEIRIRGTSESPWFVAKDICDILELTNITNSLRNIPEKWMTLKIFTHIREYIFQLYSLICVKI